MRRLATWLAIALPLLAALAPAGAQEAWWNYVLPHRRVVNISDVPKTGLPGDEIGVVTFSTAGLILPDGSDIRVTTHDGTVLASRVLMVGPGDIVRVAFALKPPVTRYFVYFGPDRPARPVATQPAPKLPDAPKLDIRRGLLMETWNWTGQGPIANPRQVKGHFDAAKELLGRNFRGQIFVGHNPFGPQSRVLNSFTGYIVAPEDGEYVFSTSSQDASFLLIDGNMVVQNGGQHPPQRVAVRTDKLRLAKGLHEIKVLHACDSGDPVVMAAWQEPGGKRIWTIPPEAFSPVRVGKCGILERYGQDQQADFSPAHTGETFVVDRYFQRYRFEALTSVRGTARPEFAWEFGDGLRGVGSKVEHVYLRSGPFKVTLTVRIGGDVIKRTNTLAVARPWDGVAENKIEPLGDFAQMVLGYDLSAYEPRDLDMAIHLFRRAALPDGILKAGDALVKKPAASSSVLLVAMPIYAETLIEQTGDFPRAAAAFSRAAEMTPEPLVAAAMTLKAGQTALAGRDAEGALANFDRVIKKFSATTAGSHLREARIGLGDVWRLRGDYAKAMQCYQDAGVAQRSGFEKEAVRKGDLERHVEDYLRTSAWKDARDFLLAWESEFPTEKLEGYSTLLRVRLAMGQKQYDSAAREAEDVIRVNPRSNYVPELLMQAADAYRALDKLSEAHACWNRIAKDYPESPLSIRAKEKLSAPASRPASGPTSRPVARPASNPTSARRVTA